MINKVQAFWPTQKSAYTEEELLKNQIKQVQAKLDHAWNNLRFADPAYIDVAVMDIHQVELEFGLLTRKYRMLKGEQPGKEVSQNPRLHFSWLNQSNTHIKPGT